MRATQLARDMVRLLLCAALAAMGCSIAAHPPDAYHVRLDPSLTAEQSELAISVLYEWSQATGFRYDTNVSADACGFDLIGAHGCMHIQTVTADNAHRICGGHQCCSKKTPESIMGISSEIYLQDLPQYNERAIRHEIGHALGLGHDLCSNQPTAGVEGTAMCAYWEGESNNITHRDIDQYFSVRGFR